MDLDIDYLRSRIKEVRISIGGLKGSYLIPIMN